MTYPHDDAPDWTREDYENDKFDGLVIPKGHADGKTSAKIVEDTRFPVMPEGPQLLFVKSIAFAVDDHGNAVEKAHAGFVDGEKIAYDCYDATITLALVSDPKCTVNQFFQLPPSDPEQARLQALATTKPDGKQKGFHFNQFRHFLGALGFTITDGSVPDEAMVPRNWRFWPDGSPRQIVAEIVPQLDRETNQPKVSQAGQPFMQVKLFSYVMSEDTCKRLKIPVQGTLPGSGIPPTAMTGAKAANGNGSKHTANGGHSAPKAPAGRPAAAGTGATPAAAGATRPKLPF